jgi:hypothetical protein
MSAYCLNKDQAFYFILFFFDLYISFTFFFFFVFLKDLNLASAHNGRFGGQATIKSSLAVKFKIQTLPVFTMKRFYLAITVHLQGRT